jgi:hypothetical protein
VMRAEAGRTFQSFEEEILKGNRSFKNYHHHHERSLSYFLESC